MEALPPVASSATGAPVDSRPRKQRRGARVVVRCGQQVLLMADSDPGVEGSAWWVTPGGGVDERESSREAAARELAEETGHRVSAGELLGPVAHRVVTHGYSDRVLVQSEDFWLLDVVEPFEVSTAGFTEGEQQRMGGWGWFGVDELATITVWPAELAELVADARPAAEPRDWGEVEESTVPVG